MSKKTTKILFSIILSHIFIFSFILPCFAEATSDVYEESQREFNPENILVLIKKEYSEFGKEYSPAEFDEELIESVEVLNQINLGDDTSGYDLEYWQHILSLTLKEPSADNVEKAIEAAYNNPKVEVAHKNYKYSLDTDVESNNIEAINNSSDLSSVVEAEFDIFNNYVNPASTSTWRIGVTPNDTRFNDQSAIFFTKANRAWAFATGNSNVLVGIVDTGIDQHEDINYNTALSKNFTNKPGLFDDLDHGTLVAGVIGAKTNNARGVAGVCWNVSLVNLKVFQADENGKPESSILWLTNAINYASQKSIKLLNISLEYADIGDEESSLTSVINSYNGLIVCSAGNVDEPNEQQTDIDFPSKITSGKIISVASCDNSGILAPKSKYSTTHVDLITQGVNVLSTIYVATYEYKGGTSMATPLVTGAAALLLGINPNYTWLQLRSAILGMVDVDPEYQDFVAMSGKLNILQSVLIALGYGGVGDVDMNGSITAADARLALRISSKIESLDTIQQAVMIDVNYDDSINAADARLILRISADIE